MSDSLPNEVITEILSRLSVKSVIRLRCVSKTWYSLISTPNFIATHRSRALSNLVVFHHFDYRLEKDRAIRIHLLSLDPEIEERSLLAGPLKSIRDPWCSFCMGVIGSANGLFCLSKGSEYFLCNPSIEKAISLPRPNIGCRERVPRSLGFGYDPKTDDYKLVRVVDVEGTAQSLVEIYTLRTGAWRSFTAPRPPYLTYFSYISVLHNVFFNGAVHWPARTRENHSPFRNLIVLFDMEDEVFREMAMPKSLQDADYLKFFIAVVDGLLALIPIKDNGDMPVWVMKEYGIVESWTEQFDIKFEFGSYGPIGFTKNGEVLVDHKGHLCSYERNSERSWDLHVCGISRWLYFCTYVESLALLNVANGVLGVKVTSFCVSKLKEKEMKRKRKKRKKENTDVGTNVRDQLQASRTRSFYRSSPKPHLLNIHKCESNHARW